MGPSPCTCAVYSREEETGTLSANSDARHTVIGANSGAASDLEPHFHLVYEQLAEETLENTSGKFLAHRTDSVVSVIEIGPCRKYRESAIFV